MNKKYYQGKKEVSEIKFTFEDLQARHVAIFNFIRNLQSKEKLWEDNVKNRKGKGRIKKTTYVKKG